MRPGGCFHSAANAGCSIALALLLVFRPLGARPADNFDDLVRRAEDAIGKQPKEAASLYRQALVLRPRWSEGWLYLGATLLQLGLYTESRDALRKGADLDPSKGTAWAYLGLAEYKVGDYREALTHIVKGESLGLPDKPDFVTAVRYHAALIYLRISEPAGAIDQLRPLVRAGNQSVEIVQALGISALSLSTLPERLSPDERVRVELAGRAASAFLGEHADQAAPLFEKLAEQYPADPGVHYMYGVFLIDRDPEAAANQFRKELQITPAHLLARVQLALLLMQKGDFDNAEVFAREAVHLQPENALCRVTLGRVLLGKGSTKEAIAELQEGERVAPNAARTHYYLQQAYQRAGRVADAQREKLTFNKLRAEQEPVTVTNQENTK